MPALRLHILRLEPLLQLLQSLEAMGDLVLLYLLHFGIRLAFVFKNGIPAYCRQLSALLFRCIPCRTKVRQTSSRYDLALQLNQPLESTDHSAGLTSVFP